MYELTDKAINYLNKRTAEEFSLLPIDEINILGSKKLYYELDKTARTVYLRLGESIYEDFDTVELILLLDDYNPVTRYIYTNEVERKRSRFLEAILSGGGEEEKKRSMRLWSTQSTQYAIEVTDKAFIMKLKSEGVKQVIWVTEKDDRVCKECSKRDGVSYDIDNIPPKPHIGCRCFWRAKK